ncbi:MAG: glycosyltransferase family 39 protein [Chloroflexota bacterium]|nr:glycosyltransferase family 39 protein [Chloroflexota bacterium]
MIFRDSSHSGTEKPKAARSSLRRALPLLIILLLATGLRFYRLDEQSLWADEGNSAALARRTPASIARDAAHDIHPPLYYWLLHFWMRVFGGSETGLRSLSAMLGVLLVALTYLLGNRLFGHSVGLAAALTAALSPFQVYYSQEARMYILLALEGAALMYTLVRYLESEKGAWLVGFVLSAAAGLYTHYSFPILWGLANAAWLAWIIPTSAKGRLPRRIGVWLMGQLVIVGFYAPWLPIAYRQLSAWPAISQAHGLRFYVHQAFRLWGLGRTTPCGRGAFLLLWGMIVLWLMGAWPARQDKGRPLSLWLRQGLALSCCLLPVLFQWGMSLFRPAYRPKFFLVGAPAFSILVGRGIVDGLHTRWWVLRDALAIAGLSLILVASSTSLAHYYFDPAFARDDYRNVAAYIAAVEREGDAILLNAPGQWDVFTYYYEGQLPIYPLPRERPPEEDRTLAELREIGRGHRRLFCLLWATDESDPERIVEGWLDQHAYKALDLWRGNVRFVTYALPKAVTSAEMEHKLDVRVGDRITLQGYTLREESVTAGEILQLTLFWRAEAPIEERYRVFVQLLDAGNHIVGQRDSEPGGGARLTTLWPVGETITDNHGVLIHPGTPPGRYRLIAGLYSLTTGERLSVDGDDKALLGQISVTRPPASLPLEAYDIQHPTQLSYEPLALLGYDVYKLGFDWRPEEPLHPGDILHLNLYWQARRALHTRWRLNLRLVACSAAGHRDKDDQTWWSGQQIPLAGQLYPTTEWQPGEIIRGQYDLLIPAHAPPGRYRLEGEVQPLGGGSNLQPLWKSEWLQVRR